ncbi:hypothetical protein [Sphingobium boeckii]|uniref:Ig-like domain-containing protein n=1 Tax=Sphingobium boeckii TaxID=1082345 RepID=A0A7W9ECV7_9SPHN|nr:hypothetical protein [Sphingobium boeckii]MBB5684304.1 hypothetical protein [Sphingobium boeckii]
MYRTPAARRAAADAAGKAPVNSALPAITGTRTQGQTLTCSTGTWSRAPSFAYQWIRDGVPISGATAATRVLAAGDVGATLRCAVTALANGVRVKAKSLATTAIIAA